MTERVKKKIFLWEIIKKALFCLPPEWVHEQMVDFLERAPLLPRGVNFLKTLSQTHSVEDILDPFEMNQKVFRHRLGLAAGFDKNGRLLGALPYLGFSFAEIGTVTPKAQPGNPKPRLFRVPEQEALFNCLGFNNDGAERVALRIEKSKQLNPKLFKHFGIGINIGKNKDTPLEVAAKDYQAAVMPFKNLVDYVVINVSSPNTPGLRSLQSLNSLKEIVSLVQNQIQKWTQPQPLFIKLAPEILNDSELTLLIQELEKEGVSGWVLSNTLAGSWKGRQGGWSGQPVKESSELLLKRVREVSNKKLISVGGINSAQVASQRIKNGASLLQIYTAWVYQGPRFITDLAAKTKEP